MAYFPYFLMLFHSYYMMNFWRSDILLDFWRIIHILTSYMVFDIMQYVWHHSWVLMSWCTFHTFFNVLHTFWRLDIMTLFLYCWMLWHIFMPWCNQYLRGNIPKTKCLICSKICKGTSYKCYKLMTQYSLYILLYNIIYSHSHIMLTGYNMEVVF